MRNKLSDLNNHLFEQLERLNDEDLQGNKLDEEIKRSNALTKVANTIVSNGNLVLQAHKHATDAAGGNTPKLLSVDE